MEKDYEKLFAVKYVLQKEGLENLEGTVNILLNLKMYFLKLQVKNPDL